MHAKWALEIGSWVAYGRIMKVFRMLVRAVQAGAMTLAEVELFLDRGEHANRDSPLVRGDIASGRGDLVAAEAAYTEALTDDRPAAVAALATTLSLERRYSACAELVAR